MKQKKIAVPVVIIGDGILGLSIARKLYLMGLDAVIIGSNSTKKDDEASLRNHGILQSGILQSLFTTQKTDENGIVRFDKNGREFKMLLKYYQSIKTSRDLLMDLFKQDDCFYPLEKGDEGLLQLHPCDLDQEKDLLDVIKELKYPERYADERSPWHAANEIGDRLAKSHAAQGKYFDIPDIPFDVGRMIACLKAKILDESHNSSGLGNAYFMPLDSELKKINECGKGDNQWYDIIMSDGTKLRSTMLVVTAGIGSKSVLRKVKEDYAASHKVSAKAMVLLKSKPGFDFKLAKPFFARYNGESNTFIGMARHGKSIGRGFDHVVIGRGRGKSIKLPNDKSYEELRELNLTDINNEKDQVVNCATIHADLVPGSKDWIETSKFCCLLGGKRSYTPYWGFVEGTNIAYGHPGLATAAMAVGDAMGTQIKARIDSSGVPTTKGEDILLSISDEYHEKIRRKSSYSASWNFNN